MKQVSLQTLKSSLSSLVAEAEAGTTIVVTRHNHPVAQLGPPTSSHVHGGRAASAPGLKPAIKGGTRGQYLTVLMEDRGNR